MSRIDLQPFARDAQVAVVNLKSRGYHIARNTAVVLKSPGISRQNLACLLGCRAATTVEGGHRLCVSFS